MEQAVCTGKCISCKTSVSGASAAVICILQKLVKMGLGTDANPCEQGKELAFMEKVNYDAALKPSTLLTRPWRIGARGGCSGGVYPCNMLIIHMLG